MKSLLPCIILLMWATTLTLAQTARVTGTTIDEQGQPLPGVNIIEKGTINGTTTDISGNYVIEVDPNAVLIFSFVGYLSEEMPIAGKSIIDIQLTPDVTQLGEIVVIGYGQVKRSDLTGSVASVKGEALTQRPVTSLDQGLKGLSAGVQVISGSGEPGGPAAIRIRGASSINGSNEPLYVIDGFPISNSGVSSTLTDLQNTSTSLNPLATINPDDIESIDVLKDASATAIYGSRGANGVIMITTKRGKYGSKPQVSYNGYAGPQMVIKKLDILDAEQFVELSNRGHVWSQTYNNDVDPSTIEPIYETREENGQRIYVVDNGNEVTGTDWQDEIFRTAMIQSHQLSIRGGSQDLRYLVSTNYFDQEGIIINSRFRRGSARINLDANLSPKLTIGNSLTITRTENNGVFATTNSAPNSVVGAALQMPPIVPVRNPDGTFAFMDEYSRFGSTTNNPVALATEPRNDLFSTRILWSAFGEYEIIEGLKYKANFGVDINTSRQELYQPDTYFTGSRIRSESGLTGEGGIANLNSNSWLHESTLSYSKTIARDHNIDLLGGFTTQRFYNRNARLVKRGFISNDLENYSIENGEEFVEARSETGESESRLDSWLGRLNYNYKNRYYFTFSARADGSSTFSSGDKWGFFPSGAVAWRLTDESFMPQSEILSDVKLRASYGSTGIPTFAYASLAQIGTEVTTVGGDRVIGFAPQSPGNNNLIWESTDQYDIGVDIELFERLNLTVDYYSKTTNDLIFNVTLPSSSGFTSAPLNAGSIENKGWEISLGTPVLTGDFTWNINANFSANQNEVVDLGASDEILVQNSLISERQPLGAFWTYTYLGVFQNEQEISETPYAANYNATSAGASRPIVPGHAKVLDRDGNGVIDPADRSFTGDPNPNFIYGITSNMSYKNFTLDFIITGISGIDIWNQTYRTAFNGNLGGTTDLLDSWTPGSGSDIPAATFTFTGETRQPLLRSSNFPTDVAIEDGSFIRLDNIKLGYTLPISNWAGTMMVYIAANNLLTITDYRGYDPDVNTGLGNAGAGSSAILGRDLAAYPRAKSVLIGLNVNF